MIYINPDNGNIIFVLMKLAGQQHLFQKIQSKLPSHTTLEQELVKALHVDLMTAFALVRQQKTLSFDQAVELSKYFSIALGDFQMEKAIQTPFNFIGFDYNVSSLEEYFVTILNEFNKVDLFGERKIIYAASELPLFSIFQFPELAAFKLFFWGKTVYNLPDFKKKQFSLDFLSEELMDIGATAWEQYLKIPSVEVWSSNIVNDILTQIFFFWKYRIFRTKHDAILICNKVIELLNHVEMQARVGKKFHPMGELPKKENFEMYYNDAHFNALAIDRNKEEEAVELFAANIVDAGNMFLENPMETPFIPNWSRIQSADPDLLRELRQAVAEDAKI